MQPRSHVPSKGYDLAAALRGQRFLKAKVDIWELSVLIARPQRTRDKARRAGRHHRHPAT